jgi:hypothetical protein
MDIVWGPNDALPWIGNEISARLFAMTDVEVSISPTESNISIGIS